MSINNDDDDNDDDDDEDDGNKDDSNGSYCDGDNDGCEGGQVTAMMMGRYRWGRR